MDIHVKGFPFVYFNGVCQTHDCKLELRVEESKAFRSETVTGAQVTTLRCLEAGPPRTAGCEDSWELSILVNGEIRIGL